MQSPSQPFFGMSRKAAKETNENGTVKQNNQSDFKAFSNQPITLQENERPKKPMKINVKKTMSQN